MNQEIFSAIFLNEFENNWRKSYFEMKLSARTTGVLLTMVCQEHSESPVSVMRSQDRLCSDRYEQSLQHCFKLNDYRNSRGAQKLVSTTVLAKVRTQLRVA